MLLDKSISQLAKLLRSKKVSSVDLVTEAYDRIADLNPQLNSFISLRDKEEVIKEAKKADEGIDQATSLLHGIPYSLKDAYVNKETQTTCGSQVLDGFNSPYEATVQKKLKDSGAILIGKNNLDAWGHGGSTENTDYKVGKNPWDITRIPGGSSGGSAAAISSRMISFSIGEDTGGSIRNPSSMCNTSGLKVSYGRVSRYGTISYASSLDSVGPMAKSVEDLALVLKNIIGKDKLDATSSNNNDTDYLTDLNKKVSKTIGLPKEFFDEGLDPKVKEIILKAVKKYEDAGHKVVEVSIPLIKYGVSIYYLTGLSETSSNMARYDGVRYGHSRQLLSDETKRRIMLGSYALSAGYADELYKKAQQARTKLIEEFTKAFKECDVLLAPVTPSIPAKIGELINDPLKSFLEDLYTGPINVAGLTSLSIPAGFTQDKLPVGMQLIGKRFHEAELLQLGHAYQQLTNWHLEKPSIIQ
ncbi:MAG: Asp-tRNA(Asn)/Glu-tRNA(Gln) amidotransferase subunit GatA [Candidatus Pacebacteria bacterium]|jgi:aspartyl-tRNA(Asn)/glutamyl-tRNA(Gln) amidotransferase subunit A|nr:Asp-tRNA(Asn)/Glu-tRNA(Gln) amidotransferase subunit GatA [Candidatus Paceibacterota bacterium]MBT3512082.1 Asp-tRNA(Asn)/Glu-tRNA(Gln) amidotransferase subunit GatA [Candidatus Paceibacterota bacterium]MBT4005210.1 Asp-tRNA(Asn)/Glu-tRNA(Gln) amidotransferase subunit GatA [Candidatus Paceibacterota bacterium]MBT4358580.1 Asp-tRNA(Asn)/Glu-tRNA(Gln) amidotransferase subunit GatA [Candidatus Paceibacterota bacterium]MBT4680669.1 Asp-tRNA(Asn)/Glu-tRNA(Gln) amidotransferase subunit GatA [Candi